MTTRWWWWPLAAVPALAGAVSLALEVGDFRSSGLIAGVSISIGLAAITLLLRAPWRGRRGIGRLLPVVPPLLLGMISLVGLSEGLPEFFQARGLFIDVESVGPIKVVIHDGAVVVVGSDTEGSFVWVSGDGSEWSIIDDSTLAELELVDALVANGSVVVLGRSTETDAAGVVLVSEDGRTYEERGRFSNSEFGTIPQAMAPFGDGLVVISDIYGNDIEFYSSHDTRSWMAGQPSPMFDDGESARDIACSSELCIGVGFYDASYRPELEANAGAAWTVSSRNDFQPVDYHFNAGRLDAIAWNTSGFVAVADSDADRGLAWHSSDGVEWRPLPGPFSEMVIDGVEATDAALVVFGRNPISGDLMLWSSEDNVNWSAAVVGMGFPAGSRLRSVASTENGLIAVGINAETFDPLVWTSSGGNGWQEGTVLPAR